MAVISHVCAGMWPCPAPSQWYTHCRCQYTTNAPDLTFTLASMLFTTFSPGIYPENMAASRGVCDLVVCYTIVGLLLCCDSCFPARYRLKQKRLIRIWFNKEISVDLKTFGSAARRWLFQKYHPTMNIIIWSFLIVFFGNSIFLVI